MTKFVKVTWTYSTSSVPKKLKPVKMFSNHWPGKPKISKLKSKVFFFGNQNMRPLSPSCINFYCHSFSEDGVAVITPSDEDIALEITVTNKNGDDAHQSRLAITLPDIVRYSSYSTTAVSTEKLVFPSLDRMFYSMNPYPVPYASLLDSNFDFLLPTCCVTLKCDGQNILEYFNDTFGNFGTPKFDVISQDFFIITVYL